MLDEKTENQRHAENPFNCGIAENIIKGPKKVKLKIQYFKYEKREWPKLVISRAGRLMLPTKNDLFSILTYI